MGKGALEHWVNPRTSERKVSSRGRPTKSHGVEMLSCRTISSPSKKGSVVQVSTGGRKRIGVSEAASGPEKLEGYEFVYV
jgi:hypothetical protein